MADADRSTDADPLADTAAGAHDSDLLTGIE
jgi:hypothetical protein